MQNTSPSLALQRAIGDNKTSIVTVTPPQTNTKTTTATAPTPAVYLLAVDTSYSMHSPATVVNDDGDRVEHGFSLLDLAKHAAATIVETLGQGDRLSVITFSDTARVLVPWTDMHAGDAGKAAKESARAMIDGMRPETSTNLLECLNLAYAQLASVPDLTAEDALGLTFNVILLTDGRATPSYDPPRGDAGYLPHVRRLSEQMVGRFGPHASKVTLTSIGLGNDINSELLSKMSDAFLHIPDPGSVGPFVVNLLGAIRSTACLDGVAASDARLVVEPAEALAGPLAGYRLAGGAAEEAHVPLGALAYDQPRHVLLPLEPPGAPKVTRIHLEVAGRRVASVEASGAEWAVTDSDALGRRLAAEALRLKTVDVLRELVDDAGRGTARAPPAAAPLSSLLDEMAASPAASEPDTSALRRTLEAELLLAVDAANWGTWGAHYLRTFSAMLLRERRSNFRDEALEHFGRDAAGVEALFEKETQAAEAIFTTLKPPTPSVKVGSGDGGGGVARGVPIYTSMPAEYMRAGGCFAPDAEIKVAATPTAGADADERVRLDQARAGQWVRVADGGVARIVCVVVTPCVGGRAILARLPSGLELTKWHPVRDAANRWRFPNLIGKEVIRTVDAVYNLVLDRAHELEVSGTRAITLGHGLKGPVVEHAYWGGEAVLKDLRRLPGWAEGRVVLDAADAGRRAVEAEAAASAPMAPTALLAAVGA